MDIFSGLFILSASIIYAGRKIANAIRYAADCYSEAIRSL